VIWYWSTKCRTKRSQLQWTLW